MTESNYLQKLNLMTKVLSNFFGMCLDAVIFLSVESSSSTISEIFNVKVSLIV